MTFNPLTPCPMDWTKSCRSKWPLERLPGGPFLAKDLNIEIYGMGFDQKTPRSLQFPEKSWRIQYSHTEAQSLSWPQRHLCYLGCLRCISMEGMTWNFVSDTLSQFKHLEVIRQKFFEPPGVEKLPVPNKWQHPIHRSNESDEFHFLFHSS